jgi:hypothetical protein
MTIGEKIVNEWDSDNGKCLLESEIQDLGGRIDAVALDWIPVEQDNPKEPGWYLVWKPDTNFWMQVFFREGEFYAFMGDRVGYVTHWAIVPAPTKGTE